MKLSLHALDDEIREVENRIALERLEIEDAVAGCSRSLRDAVSSPKTLLALAGVGFMLGKLVFGRKVPSQQVVIPQKTGMLGLLTGLAGTAVSLMQPGLSGSLARWAVTKAFGSKPASVTTPPGPRATPPPTHVALRTRPERVS